MRVGHVRDSRITGAGYTGDLIFLAGIVLASVSAYVLRIGFYSDDWAFLSVMRHADDQSLPGLVRVLWDHNANLRMRPTQIAYQVVLYSAFGLKPVGYHIVNALVLTGMILLLYLILRRLRAPRPIAVAVPLVYALLPSYSTDRFWFAAFGYTLSMALALGSIFADIRALESSRWLIVWKTLSLFLLAAACLGYEIVIPLLLVSPVVTWTLVRGRDRVAARLNSVGLLAYLLAPYTILAILIAYKAMVARGAGLGEDPLFYIVRLIAGAVKVHFASFGIGLPYAAWWGLERLPVIAIVLGAAVGLAAFLYVRIVLQDHPFPGSRTWVKVAVAGALAFGLGYSVFLTTGRIGFSSSGPSNRTGLAAALGAAAVIVAGLGLLARVWSTDTVRRVAFAASIGAVCSMGFFVVTALGDYWVVSWREQNMVLWDIRADLPSVPPGTTVVLHGVCPYEGPAVVFESYWDLDGALEIAYGDPTISADVTTSNMTVETDGIRTTVYAGTAFHPYGEQLLLYDRTTGRIIPLANERSALDFFGSRDPEESCAGAPGYGELLLPADRLFYGA